MIFGKINFIDCILPFFIQERLLLAAEHDLAQKCTAAQFTPENCASKRTGIKQCHTRLGRECLFFNQRPYKSANNTAAIDGCDGSDDNPKNKRGDYFVDNICGLRRNRKVIIRTKLNGKIGLVKVRNQLAKCRILIPCSKLLPKRGASRAQKNGNGILHIFSPLRF